MSPGRVWFAWKTSRDARADGRGAAARRRAARDGGRGAGRQPPRRSAGDVAGAADGDRAAAPARPADEARAPRRPIADRRYRLASWMAVAAAKPTAGLSPGPAAT